MPGVFGLNILGQYVSDAPGLLAFARRLNPAAFVVMDSPALFQQMRDAAPNAIPIYRTYHPNDAEVHLRWSPAAWLDQFAGVVSGGYLQTGNEPNGYGNITTLASWYVQVMRAARQRGRQLAVCAFGVGHPDEKLIQSGAFDGVLRELADGYHLLLLHEYARDSTTEQPYHIGRFQFWLDRAKQIGVVAPRIMIGEYGRDNVGDGTGGGSQDGWRGVGWSEDTYAAFLTSAAYLYSRANIPACIYCYGSGADRSWQSFNIEGAAHLQAQLVTANTIYEVNMSSAPTMPAVPKPPNAGESIVAILNAPKEGINLRDAPDTSGKRLTTVMDDTLLLWYRGGAVQADGYTWYWVEIKNANESNWGGWMALIASHVEDQFVVTESSIPTPETILDVPYFSQLTSPGADKDTADCGETSVRMLIGWLLKRAGVPDFAGLTIDDLTRDAGKKMNAYLSIGQIENLLRLYGVPTAKLSYGGVTLERIEQEINAGRPLIALTRYSYVYPGDRFTAGHWLVVTGYSSTHIIVNDPYRGGANFRIPRTQFEQALTQWGTPPSNPSHSGVFLQ